VLENDLGQKSLKEVFRYVFLLVRSSLAYLMECGDCAGQYFLLESPAFESISVSDIACIQRQLRLKSTSALYDLPTRGDNNHSGNYDKNYMSTRSLQAVSFTYWSYLDRRCWLMKVRISPGVIRTTCINTMTISVIVTLVPAVCRSPIAQCWATPRHPLGYKSLCL